LEVSAGVAVVRGQAAMSFSFARGSASRKVCIGAYLLQRNPDKEDLEETKLVDHEKKSADDATGVSWSNDGQILATGGNNRINLWRRDGTLMSSIDTGDEVGKEVGRVAWSPDGTMLAVAS
jgi:WD40 repeat protein